MEFSLRRLVESDTDLEFIESAFARALGRAVDPQGLRTYLDHLDAGMSRTALLKQLSEADETLAEGQPLDDSATAGELDLAECHSLNRLMQLCDERFVLAAYLVLFGRKPDAAGRSHYLRRLHTGMSRQNLLHALIYSAEGRARASEIAGLGPAPRLMRLRGWLRRFDRRHS